MNANDSRRSHFQMQESHDAELPREIWESEGGNAFFPFHHSRPKTNLFLELCAICMAFVFMMNERRTTYYGASLFRRPRPLSLTRQIPLKERASDHESHVSVL